MESCLKSKLAPKLERKYMEKNRRNHMKNLCNQLHSMLPTHSSSSKETTMKLPDQIDAAVNYIETLKMNLEKNKKNLEELKMGPKRAQSLNATNEPGGPSTKSPPQIEFHEMGPNMVVVLISSLENIATFNNIIRLCHEEGVEIVSKSFKLNGNSTLQISHETKVMMELKLSRKNDYFFNTKKQLKFVIYRNSFFLQINKSSTMEFRATTLCDKMEELIYGPSHGNDVESQLYLWDYKIEFDAFELLPTNTYS